MSKELPYFKFNPSEWFEGDITLKNERVQGVFILICAWYWKKDCMIDIDFIKKRVINGKASLKQCLQELLDSDIIKLNGDQTVTISFLDEQYNELSEKRQKLVDAGRIGGKASLKHRRSNRDKDKDKERDKDKINIPFDEFWDLYDKKVGDKSACEKKWNKLKDSERDTIIKILPIFKDSISDKQYQPYPATYLNQRRWENEIKKPSQFQQPLSV